MHDSYSYFNLLNCKMRNVVDTRCVFFRVQYKSTSGLAIASHLSVTLLNANWNSVSIEKQNEKKRINFDIERKNCYHNLNYFLHISSHVYASLLVHARCLSLSGGMPFIACVHIRSILYRYPPQFFLKKNL